MSAAPSASNPIPWSEVMLTLTPLAPVKVEPESNGGTKLLIVSRCGKLVCKLPSNRRADLALAEAIAASINVTAKALVMGEAA